MTVLSSTKDDLFNLDLIRSYVDKDLNPRFVERHWLKRQVEDKLANSDCRFVLLTAEPGAGKSAFMAWLAHQHPDWCRYFIRRDQRTPLGDVGSYSFLLQVGFQLAATYPDLFKQEQIKIVVEQRIGTATNSEIVGAEIGKMFASPFYKKVIQIQQQVTHSKDTNITGVRIGEFYATERDLPIENLQFMALFDPAKAMMKQVQEAMDYPQRQIVVLVDALDELRYQDSELSLLKWLTNCPELPANLRFVLTCRPDDDLLRAFRGSQQGRIQEISIAEEDPDLEKDLTRYTRFLIETPEVNQALIEMHQGLDQFTHQAVKKANGNFGYLGAIGRAVDEAIRQDQQELLREILKLSELPDTLQDLYAFFLGKIKDAVAKEKVSVEDAEGEIGFVPVWSAVYKPILGILSVALEPLTPTQIHKLSLIQAEFDDVTGAIEKLQQFLDQLGNSYRLYHSTLPEFFTSPKTKERTDYSYCYVDAVKQNQRIVNYYQSGAKSWAEVDLKKIAEDDYGRRHLAQHLVKGDRADELHKLISLEKDGRNAWFDAKEWVRDVAGFLADVTLAGKQVSGELLSSKTIGQQCHYALIAASLNSRANQLPNQLLVEAIKSEIWSPADALAYAKQISNVVSRVQTLSKIAPVLPEKLNEEAWQIALKTTLSIQDEEVRTILLSTSLASILPEELKEEIFRSTSSIQRAESRLIALCLLASVLPSKLQQEAWQISLSIIVETYKGFSQINWLLMLTLILPQELRTGSLELILLAFCNFENEKNEQKIQHEYGIRGDLNLEVNLVASEAFSKVFDSQQTREIIQQIGIIDVPKENTPMSLDEINYYQSQVLSALVPLLPDESKEEVFSKALSAAFNIQGEYFRSRAFSKLTRAIQFYSNSADFLLQQINTEKLKQEIYQKISKIVAREFRYENLVLIHNFINAYRNSIGDESFLEIEIYSLQRLTEEINDSMKYGVQLSDIIKKNQDLLNQFVNQFANVIEEGNLNKNSYVEDIIRDYLPGLRQNILSTGKEFRELEFSTVIQSLLHTEDGVIQTKDIVSPRLTTIIETLKMENPELLQGTMHSHLSSEFFSVEVLQQINIEKLNYKVSEFTAKKFCEKNLALIEIFLDDFKASSGNDFFLQEKFLRLKQNLDKSIKETTNGETNFSGAIQQIIEQLINFIDNFIDKVEVYLSEVQRYFDRTIYFLFDLRRTILLTKPLKPLMMHSICSIIVNDIALPCVAEIVEKINEEDPELLQKFSDLHGQIEEKNKLCQLREKFLMMAFAPIFNIEDNCMRVKTWIQFTLAAEKEVSQEMLKEIIKVISDISEESNQFELLTNLLPILPNNLKNKVWKEFFEKVQIIQRQGYHFWSKEIWLSGLELIIQLAPDLRDDLQQEAWRLVDKLVFGIQDREERSYVLSALAPYLPDNLKRQFLYAVLDIQDDRWQVNVLKELAPFLPAEKRQETWKSTLKIALNIKQDEYRLRILSTLVLALPNNLKQEVVSTILVDTLKLDKYCPYLDEVLINIAPILPGRIQQETWRVVLRKASEIGRNDLSRFNALNALAQVLPSEIKQESVAHLLSIGNNKSRERLDALVASALIAPNYLSESDWQRIIVEIHNEENVYYKRDALCILAPVLPTDHIQAVWREIFMASLEVSSRSVGAKAQEALVLANPIGFIQKEWQELLDTVLSNLALYRKLEYLRMLVPLLPNEIRQKTVEMFLVKIKSHDVTEQIDSFNVLSIFKPDAIRQKICQIALAAILRTHENDEKIHGLIPLFPLFSEEMKQEVCQRVLLTIINIQPESEQAINRLDSLIPVLPGSLKQQALSIALSMRNNPYGNTLYQLVPSLQDELKQEMVRSTIHIPTILNRKNILEELGLLKHTIFGLGGAESVGEIVHAIQNVGRWWK